MANNNILQTIINFVLSLIQKQTVQAPPIAPSVPYSPQIDWTNPGDMVSKYFSVQNCLLLHDWNRLATLEDGYDSNQLIILCSKLDQVREIIGFPMNIHCIFRSQAYNAEQKITPVADVHSMSMAVDFDAGPNLTTDDIKAKLAPVLEELGLRMENNGAGSSWVHLDIHPVIHNRYFTV